MFYCIVNLVTKRVEVPLECICNLLKTAGKELEQVNLHFFFIMLIRYYISLNITYIYYKLNLSIS